MGSQVGYESWRIKRKIAIVMDVLENSEGGRNSGCSEELLRYHKELVLRRRLAKLQLTVRMERVDIRMD